MTPQERKETIDVISRFLRNSDRLEAFLKELESANDMAILTIIGLVGKLVANEVTGLIKQEILGEENE